MLHDVQIAREFFEAGKTKSYEYRIEVLKSLYDSIISHEDELCHALKTDLNKSVTESYMTEIGIVLSELSLTIKKLSNWMKPKKKRVDLGQMPGGLVELSEPFGLVLVMAPWNYPFQLAFVPLIGAIAAGNAVVLKVSNDTPHTTEVMEKIISQVFTGGEVCIFSGGRAVNEELLREKYDYIFFTGSTNVGKVVMEAAAGNLTPLTLELGGKSPCIVDSSADVEKAAKRILFGKLVNGGQTCIAPDYVLIDESVRDEFVINVERELKSFIPNGEYYMENYPKIINETAFNRLRSMMSSGDIVIGGEIDEETRQIGFTLLDDVDLNSRLMNEEIFGPLLPMITYENLEDAISFIKTKSKPLALYMFSKSDENIDRVLSDVSFGGGCINDTITHFVGHHAGFGGVGDSGMGSYHGKLTFDTFSHSKTIYKKGEIFDIPVRYHPYDEKKLKLIKSILK